MTYLVCIRVQHRRHTNKSYIPIESSTTTTTTVFPTIRTPINWHIRQPKNPVFPGNYVYDSRCIVAATQNWHLSALIGGILGIIFALFLGVLLFLVLKRTDCLPNGPVGFGKPLNKRSLLGNSSTMCSDSNSRGKRSNSKRGSFYSSLWPSRSSNGRSEFSGRLREEDEDDEVDDDDEVIAEDDEDTEIDTGGKSSVRSQVGIYGGSGGTTGSSNRHSSMSSSIDAKEDFSSAAMPYLPLNGVQTRSATRRSRDFKRPSVEYDNTKNSSGVKVSEVNPFVDAANKDADLTKSSNATLSDVPHQQPKASPSPDSILEPVPGTVETPASNLSPDPSTHFSIIGIEQGVQGECTSPILLPEPQSVDLQAPLLTRMRSNKNECIWIESPMVEPPFQSNKEISEVCFENNYHDSPFSPDYESSLSLSRAISVDSRERDLSSNFESESRSHFGSLEILNEDPSRSEFSIFTEFIETI